MSKKKKAALDKLNDAMMAALGKVDLGGGHEVEPMVTPNLHWPDTMLVYEHST